MIPYVGNIEEESLENTYFRKVLYTGPHLQLVVMNLKGGEDIGMEIHEKEDQFIRVEKWVGKAVIDGVEYALADGIAVVVPAWSEHNIVNLEAEKPLSLYTIYCPKHHPDGTIHETKQDAIDAEEIE